MFELRDEEPKVIQNRLNIPTYLSGIRIRKIRRDALKEMTKRELRKNPKTTLDELWTKWDLQRIPQWTEKRRVVIITPYDGVFRKAKAELAHESLSK